MDGWDAWEWVKMARRDVFEQWMEMARDGMGTGDDGDERGEGEENGAF